MKYMSNNLRQEDVDLIEQMIALYKGVHGPSFNRNNYVTECLLGWTRHLLEKIAEAQNPKDSSKNP